MSHDIVYEKTFPQIRKVCEILVKQLAAISQNYISKESKFNIFLSQHSPFMFACVLWCRIIHTLKKCLDFLSSQQYFCTGTLNITRVSVRCGKIFIKMKASEMSRNISCKTSVISDLSFI